MSTITENINKILQVKNDLNEVLRENGIEGGRVFEDYPEKFRELFRVMQSYTEEAVDVYTGPGTAETFVPDPVITFFENTISITCPMKNATIYYSIKSESGKYDHGFIPYDVSIKIRENVYVEAFARYNGIDSNNTVSMNCEYVKGNIPDTPVITRDGIIVTITCTGNYTSIWWSTVDGNYTQYTEPVEVSNTNDVWAYSTYNDFMSDKAFDAAPEQTIVPEIPVLDTSVTNKLTITCETAGATIWYMTRSEGIWREYTGQITITESDYYRAMATLNDAQGFSSEWEYVEFFETPADPVISTSENRVYITTTTSGANIYYRKYGETEWRPYTGSFPINETGVYEAYATKNGLDSDVVSATCTYVDEGTGSVGRCYISKEDDSNLVFINCARADATIYYKISPTQISMDGFDIKDLSNYDGIYNGPFYISADCWVYAHGVRPPYDDDQITEKFLEWYDEGSPSTLRPPVINCINNVVYISSNVTGATIYYKTADGNAYMQYNGTGIPIEETTTFMAYITKDNEHSTITVKVCTYVEPVDIPDTPTVSVSNNVVTIECGTIDATIYYRVNGGTYEVYVGPFGINETCLVETYAVKDAQCSEIAIVTCEYVPFIISDYQYEYLTLHMLNGGQIGFVRSNDTYSSLNYRIWYSINNGEWTSIDPSVYSSSQELKVNAGGNRVWELIFNYSRKIDVNMGDNIRIKANIPCFAHSTSRLGIKITSNCNYEVWGNINSIIAGDDFLSYNEAYTQIGNGWGNSGPAGFFGYNDYLVNAENLILPNTNLGPYCYDGMFAGCRNLTKPPKNLPATWLVEGCYQNMFSGCFALTQSPVLPATRLVSGCYGQMFYGCSALATVTCYARENIYNISSSNSTNWNWLQFAGNGSGTFITNDPNWASHWVTGDGQKGIPRGWKVKVI